MDKWLVIATLAVAVRRMAKLNTVIRWLPAVDTLCAAALRQCAGYDRHGVNDATVLKSASYTQA